MSAPAAHRETVSHDRLVELMGRGAMGEVWLAEDTQLPRKVAIKLLLLMARPRTALVAPIKALVPARL